MGTTGLGIAFNLIEEQQEPGLILYDGATSAFIVLQGDVDVY